MTKLFLVRHAEPVSPATFDGSDFERPLSPRGRKQALWTAHKLKASGALEVLSSPLARCLQTAQVIAQELGLQVAVDDSLHIARVFQAQPDGISRVYVAHSNNIPVALDQLGVDCNACGHASCWTVDLDEQGKVLRAEYLRSDGG
ncbi:MAG: histidine phosphatase family protein [Planctomycetes bacterium]|nr:histidine phosphatase family protein [Planctomycetota bacterium]